MSLSVGVLRTLINLGTSGSHDANFAAISSTFVGATHSPSYVVPSPPGVDTNAATLTTFKRAMGYLMMDWLKASYSELFRYKVDIVHTWFFPRNCDRLISYTASPQSEGKNSRCSHSSSPSRGLPPVFCRTEPNHGIRPRPTM